MSFSAEWLALREPADHAARNVDVLAAAAAYFSGRETLDIVDLGCGAGSNLRGCALAFPENQTWRLVDYDPRLLAAARTALAAWADTSDEEGDRLLLRKNSHRISVSFIEADLSQGVEHVLSPAPDLVTAAALFDLMSPAWLGRFTAALAARKLPLYTVLTYDGRETWTPPHPLDRAVNRAFCRHQRTDKGFGPSAGPEAAATLAGLFERTGYAIVEGDSPWRLDGAHGRLVRELAQGIAGAAIESGEIAEAQGLAWATARRDAAAEIGHRDLFARPR